MKVEHICYEMGYNSWESLLEQKKVALPKQRSECSSQAWMAIKMNSKTAEANLS